MKKVLLVAIDDSQHSMKAIDYAVQLAQGSEFTIELLHVQPKFNTHYANKKIGKKMLESYKEECAMNVLNKGRQRAGDEVNVTIHWRKGLIEQEICEEAKVVGAICIIMGTTSMKKVKGRLLGSKCYNVIRQAPCPVTVVI